MIIQALCELYDRLERANPSAGSTPLAPFGYSVQKVSFVIVVDRDGTLHSIEDARTTDAPEEGSKRKPRLVPRTLVVPAVPGRTVAIEAGFLCDTSAYTLGVAGEAKVGAKAADTERVRRCFDAFRERHLAAEPEIGDPGFKAVCSFLRSWRPEQAADHPRLLEVAGGFGVFQLRGTEEYVHESERVRAYWAEHNGGSETTNSDESTRDTIVPEAQSLVTGRVEPLARLHEPAIKGVVGAQTSGAKLASFNPSAFESYNKSQTYNAPVGVRDAFRYCTALNYLLASERHRVRLADTTVVFWTESPAAIEIFGQLVGGSGGQNEALLTGLRRWAESARRGLSTELGDAATPFYILGLSPNASRLSVRFWIPSTLGDVMTNLAVHVDALALEGEPEGYLVPTLQQIARETVPAKAGWPDEDRIPARLIGELGRAVLQGLPFPASLLGAIVARVRTDGWVNVKQRTESGARVGHRRACIIAACLRRREKEVPMSLNESHPDPAYHLGRLFALLDTVAEDASDRKVSRRDKYFSAASANPVTVFPRLLRLSMHDLKKFPPENAGFRIGRERQIQAICDRIDAFPSTLTLDEQGLFCLGYYQQRQDIFTRKPATA